MKLKEIVQNDNMVWLDTFNAKTAYYRVSYNQDIYEFPVDMEDVGTATMKPKDRAMLYMRYIRKAIDAGTFIKVLDVQFLEDNILHEDGWVTGGGGIDYETTNYYAKWNGSWYMKSECAGFDDIEYEDWALIEDKEKIKEIEAELASDSD